MVRVIPDVDLEGISMDELPEMPECRVLAGADPAGAVRFEVSESYARKLLQKLEQNLHPSAAGGFVPLVLPMDYPGYKSLTKGLAQLHQIDGVGLKQIQPSPTDPDLAITVIMNGSQIESSMKKNYAALKEHGRGHAYAQHVSTSWNGAVMLHQQLEAALEGDDDPLEAVDLDDPRFEGGASR